jgi:hypothetical protein
LPAIHLTINNQNSEGVQKAKLSENQRLNEEMGKQTEKTFFKERSTSGYMMKCPVSLALN